MKKTTFGTIKNIQTEYKIDVISHPNGIVLITRKEITSEKLGKGKSKQSTTEYTKCYYKPKLPTTSEELVQWLQTNPTELTPISQQQYDAYKKFDFNKINYCYPEGDILSLLNSEQFHLIIRNDFGYSHFIRNFKGEPVSRRIRIDQIGGQLRSENYDLSDLKDHLDKNPSIEDLQVVTIPSYNAAFYGEKAIECYWNPPSDSDFKKILRRTQDGRYTDDMWKLLELLKVKKFRLKGNGE